MKFIRSTFICSILSFSFVFAASLHAANASDGTVAATDYTDECRLLPNPGFQNIEAGGVATITAMTRNCPSDIIIWVAPSLPSGPTCPVPQFTDGWVVQNNPQAGSTVTFQIHTPINAAKGQRQILLYGQSPATWWFGTAALFIVNIL